MSNYTWKIGNCIDFLPSMNNKSVDLVFCDPPYNVKKDYGAYKDNLSHEDYYDFMSYVVSESKRVSRRGIAFYVGGKLTKLFFELIPDAHLVVVHKKAVGIMCNNYFLQYHSLFVTAPPLKKCKDLWNDIRLPGEGYFFREKRYNSPGQTSVRLVEKVLEYFTNEGDTILDPFLGTGTTLEACMNMSRNCMGFEIDTQWEQIYKKRLHDDKLKLDTFLEGT